MKSATSERQRLAVVSVSSKIPKGSSEGDQVISAGDIQPNIQPFPTRLILSNSQPTPSSISSFSQPFIIPSSKQPILTNTNVLTQASSQVWHSGLPPYPYKIVVLPNNVSVCYGCHSKFLDSERAFPSNLVIKHRDRRITGRRPTGELLVAADYQCTYTLARIMLLKRIQCSFLIQPYTCQVRFISNWCRSLKCNKCSTFLV